MSSPSFRYILLLYRIITLVISQDVNDTTTDTAPVFSTQSPVDILSNKVSSMESSLSQYIKDNEAKMLVREEKTKAVVNENLRLEYLIDGLSANYISLASKISALSDRISALEARSGSQESVTQCPGLVNPCKLQEISVAFFRSYLSNLTDEIEGQSRKKRATVIPELVNINKGLEDTSKATDELKTQFISQKIEITEVRSEAEANSAYTQSIVGIAFTVASIMGALITSGYKVYKWRQEHMETEKNVEYVRSVSSMLDNKGSGIKSIPVNSDVIFGTEDEHNKIDEDPNTVLITSIIKPRRMHKVTSHKVEYGNTELSDTILVTHASLKVHDVKDWMRVNNAQRPTMMSSLMVHQINNAIFDDEISPTSFVKRWGLQDIPIDIMNHYGITDLDDFDYKNLSRTVVTSNIHHREMKSGYCLATLIHSRKHIFKIICSDICIAAYPQVSNMMIINHVLTRSSHHSSACDCKRCLINDRTSLEIKKSAIKLGGTGFIESSNKDEVTIDSVDATGFQVHMDDEVRDESKLGKTKVMGVKMKNINKRVIVEKEETKTEEVMHKLARKAK